MWWLFLLLDVNCPTQKNRELAGAPPKSFSDQPGEGGGRRLRTRLFWWAGQCSSSQASISRLSCSSHRNISALARTHTLRDRTTACLASPIGNNRLVAADFDFPISFFSSVSFLLHAWRCGEEAARMCRVTRFFFGRSILLQLWLAFSSGSSSG
jgi:hypothetical protein